MLSILGLFFLGHATDYNGNNLVAVLGATKTSEEFKDFVSYWKLDKKYENDSLGIKAYVNEATGKLESILLAGTNVVLSSKKFAKYSGQLPFGLSLEDDSTVLVGKLGESQKTTAKRTLKFTQQHIVIEAGFADSCMGNIASIRFSLEGKKNNISPTATVSVADSANKPKADIKAWQPDRPTKTLPATKSGEKDETATGFKKAILSVFGAWFDAGFWSVRAGERKAGNFWNYKYTYNTTLKIPGELYNMLYCFPFISSEPDFVSVLKEGNEFDHSFEVVYHDFEKKLLQNFPSSEGWVSSCIPSQTKRLSDLELKNEHYGSVVLSYTRSPRGRHILYLRFLLYN